MSVHELDMFESVCASATKIPEDFTDPEDDWAPHAFIEAGDGTQGIMPLAHLMTDEMKDALATMILPAVVKMAKASRIVLVLSVWTSKLATDEFNHESGQYAGPPPSERPDRKEYVMVIEYTAEGVGRQAYAQILRDGVHPPTLADWEDSGAVGAGGRFVDPIVAALKEVASDVPADEKSI